MAGPRGNWTGSFGFVMAAIGSAVGLGNLIRFPKELADNGGAAFLFVYLLMLLLVGLPAILGELSLGKMAQASPVNAFRKLGGENGRRWAVLGVAGMLAAVFVLFYYSVLTGWALRFFFDGFTDGWYDDPTGHFDRVAYGPAAIFWHAVVSAIVLYIVSRGISGGIEKVNVVMIPALFLIVAGIVVYTAFQPGAGAGYRAVFDPDFSELTPRSFAAAAGQVFFSLSLGQGAMLTYASYMEKRQNVAKNGSIIAGADTTIAVLGAMMVFPVLAFTGLLTSTDPAIQGALGGTFGTAFIALPAAFAEMGAVVGRVVGTVFFLGLFFAAVSSAISLLEVPVAVLIDNLGVVRWKAAVIVGLTTYAFGVAAAVSPAWLTLYDEIAVNVFIVLGVALTTFFAGWMVKGVAKELDSGLRSRVGLYAVWLMRTVTPVAILAVFFFGGLFGTDASGAITFWADGSCGGVAEDQCQADAAGWNALAHEVQVAFGGE